MQVDIELILTICKAVRITAVLDTQGYQMFYRLKVVTMGIELKTAINPEKYSSRDQKIVSESLTITEVRPDITREVHMKVVGLPFNAPDSVVQEQVELFGGKLKGTPVLQTYRDGPSRWAHSTS